MCISVILTLFSCSNEFVPDFLIENKISTSEEIVLGEKRENPFSISKVRSVDSAVVPNYIYLKIRTNIVENVELIEAILGDLNTVPLDYEVIEGGCINTQNSGSDEFTPWFYSMTTIEKYNEVKDLGETEVIDEMYISGIISVKQIFEPYKYFSVQSIDSWFEKIKEKNCDIDLQEQIKDIFEKHGITL